MLTTSLVTSQIIFESHAVHISINNYFDLKIKSTLSMDLMRNILYTIIVTIKYIFCSVLQDVIMYVCLQLRKKDLSMEKALRLV